MFETKDPVKFLASRGNSHPCTVLDTGTLEVSAPSEKSFNTLVPNQTK